MKGSFVVSLDFELFWGMLDVCSLEQYQEHVLGGRAAIPRLLKLFQKYCIHATWATVGFQFGRSAGEVRPYFPLKEQRPTYENPKLRPYETFDRVGQTEGEAPCFFAGSLVEQIAQTPGQEIGSHTFCHFYCREPGQTVEQFRADLLAAKALAESRGIALKSLVLPRNQCSPEYIAVLKELGFTSFRDEEDDWIHRVIRWRPIQRPLILADVYFPLTRPSGYIPTKEAGVWKLTGSRMYRTIFRPLRFMEGLKVLRIKRQMLHAAKHGACYHLWWHPHNIGVETDSHLAQLEEIFRYYNVLHQKYGMESRNMSQMAHEMETEQ